MSRTQNKAQKIATRQRMAETGEPYSVARHEVEREHREQEVADAGIEDTTRERADQARERADRARERVEQLRRMAEEAQELAHPARERAERADEAAMMAHDAAALAREAAHLTPGWADEPEQARARPRAAAARTAPQEAP